MFYIAQILVPSRDSLHLDQSVDGNDRYRHLIQLVDFATCPHVLEKLRQQEQIDRQKIIANPLGNAKYLPLMWSTPIKGDAAAGNGKPNRPQGTIRRFQILLPDQQVYITGKPGVPVKDHRHAAAKSVRHGGPIQRPHDAKKLLLQVHLVDARLPAQQLSTKPGAATPPAPLTPASDCSEALPGGALLTLGCGGS